jgi:hypothetical protein
MGGLLLQLLGLLALLLAPVPALAAPLPDAQLAISAGHCDEGKPASMQAEHQDDSTSDKDKHPCCKDGMKGCCAAASVFGGTHQALFVESLVLAHHQTREPVLSGAAGPPPTEPPIFA